MTVARLRNGPAAPDGPMDVWTLVSTALQANPDGPAVHDGDRTWSGADLLGAVTALAHQLLDAGAGDGDCVAIAVDRSAVEVVGVLATLAIGAHYVAFDPQSPDKRLRTMLDIAAPAAVVAGDDTGFADRLIGLRPTPLVRSGGSSPSTLPLPAVVPDGERPAYIAFTSGSTGVPKGVRVPHRAVARLVRPGPGCCVEFGRSTRMLRLAPLAFDASTLELFAPLVAGGCLVVHPAGPVDPAELAELLVARDITALWLTAGLFRLVADLAPHGFRSVRHLLTGGDVVPPAQVRTLLTRFPALRITNGYGPTENTTFSTVCHFDRPSDVDDPLPIGAPVAGSGVIVVDENGQRADTGELYVTGLGLALDYAGSPEQTAQAFTTAPDTGERAYRTGDLVHVHPDGRLRFLGRLDRQVKIRGFRVELTEIQQALTAQPQVTDAVVVVTGTDASSRQLVAGVLADEALDLGALREALAQLLPAYCVPHLWALVDRLPLTANGKVDAARLAELAMSVDEPDEDTGEDDETYRNVCAAWENVLGKAPSGRDTNFFTAGGDSLRLARLIGFIAKHHGVRVPVRDLYRQPTPGKLAELLAAAE